ncbi:methylated-DNA--[protein]-cysteine S-methyltransferase [Paenibacillus sp. strain BS8-2]
MNSNHKDESIALYWSEIQIQDATIMIAATEHGLCYAGAFEGTFVEMDRDLATRFKPKTIQWVRDDAKLLDYGKEFIAYGTNVHCDFNGQFDLRGTPFQLKVWNALLDIPFGATRSYSDIAAAIGQPSAVRAVGSAIGANPILIRVPCHRVIGKNGKITGYRGGLDMKHKLLQLEQESSWR